MNTLLQVEHLTVEFRRREKIIPAVQDVSFNVQNGEFLGLVGESGSGKTTAALAILNLVAKPEGRISQGRILFEGTDLLSLDESALRQIRGGSIAMIFQDPFTSLNPVLSIGEQLEEVLEIHEGRRNKQKVLEGLKKVRLEDPERIYRSYPHQISGGQRQRATISMAILSRPKLLIADEPTTALDVTIQKEILQLLDSLRKEMGMAVLFITHNFGIVANFASRVIVMKDGRIVEEAETQKIFRSPSHPYTRELLNALPRLKVGR